MNKTKHTEIINVTRHTLVTRAHKVIDTWIVAVEMLQKMRHDFLSLIQRVVEKRKRLNVEAYSVVYEDKNERRVWIAEHSERVYSV